jgi:hypothetical protein
MAILGRIAIGTTTLRLVNAKCLEATTDIGAVEWQVDLLGLDWNTAVSDEWSVNVNHLRRGIRRCESCGLSYW